MESEDEIVVMVVPDYQMLEYVQRIAADLSDDSVCIGYSDLYFFSKNMALRVFFILILIYHLTWPLAKTVTARSGFQV